MTAHKKHNGLRFMLMLVVIGAFGVFGAWLGGLIGFVICGLMGLLAFETTDKAWEERHKAHRPQEDR